MTNKYSIDDVLYFLYDDEVFFARPSSIEIKKSGVHYTFGTNAQIEKPEQEVFETPAALIAHLSVMQPKDYSTEDYPF